MWEVIHFNKGNSFMANLLKIVTHFPQLPSIVSIFLLEKGLEMASRERAWLQPLFSPS